MSEIENLLTVAQVAKMLGYQESTIRRRVADKKIPFIKIEVGEVGTNRQYRLMFKKSDVENFRKKWQYIPAKETL